jgi:folate-binding protein YgfZ
MIPAASLAVYEAARNASAFIDRTDRGRLVVSGKDRASYLQGLLTNDIVALKSGEGCYAAYLTPQGRMITDMHVYELGDAILLTLGRDVKDSVLTLLDRFVFSEDVQLGDATDSFTSLTVVGPRASSTLAAVLGTGSDAWDALRLHGNKRTQFAGGAAIVLRTADTGEAGFEVLVEGGQFLSLRHALVAAGALEADPETAALLRIEAGVPKFHQDMDEETIPLEAGIEATAISQTKGCYVGQEVIIRVLHRGHGRVARKLVGLTIDGGVPPAGTVVQHDSQNIGRVTSSAYSPSLGTAIALGYVRREQAEPGTAVTVGGATASVTTLPFVSAR